MSDFDTASRLIDWWMGATSKDDSANQWFTDDFVFDTQAHILSGEDLIWNVNQKIPMSNFEMLDCVGGSDVVMAMFEAVDSVTGLRHRFAWSIHFRDGRISKILHVDTMLLHDRRQ